MKTGRIFHSYLLTYHKFTLLLPHSAVFPVINFTHFYSSAAEITVLLPLVFCFWSGLRQSLHFRSQFVAIRRGNLNQDFMSPFFLIRSQIQHCLDIILINIIQRSVYCCNFYRDLICRCQYHIQIGRSSFYRNRKRGISIFLVPIFSIITRTDKVEAVPLFTFNLSL